MKVGIITIGDELIHGFTMDSNSSWISKYLFNYGINVYKKISVGDNEESIKETLDDFILDKYSIIFITGGLGPTHDDITKKVLSKYFKSELVIDSKHLKEFKNKIKRNGLDFTHLHESQSMIIKSSKKINNNYGTALGMHIKHFESNIFVLPGVPREMRLMVEKELIPLISNKYDLYKKEFITIKTTGIYESKIYSLLVELINENINDFKVSFLPHYYGVDVRIESIKKDNVHMFNNFKKTIIKSIKKYVYGYDSETISSVLYNLLVGEKLTLSVAESCTGGLISAKITEIPGSSSIFLGSMVSYSNKFKEKILKVSKKNIKNNGVVSESVSKEMCENIKKITNSDTAISVTGLSGPSGGTELTPIGTVFITVNYKNIFKSQKFNLYPNRKIHRYVSAVTAMNMLRILINKNIK